MSLSSFNKRRVKPPFHFNLSLFNTHCVNTGIWVTAPKTFYTLSSLTGNLVNDERLTVYDASHEIPASWVGQVCQSIPTQLGLKLFAARIDSQHVVSSVLSERIGSSTHTVIFSGLSTVSGV